MRNRRAARLTATVALAALLFAKAGMALASCMMELGGPAMPHPEVATEGAAHPDHAAGSPCHEAPVNPALCTAHCQEADQSLDKHQVKVPALTAGAFRIGYPERDDRLAVQPLRRSVPAAAPPLRILYQSLLI